MKETSGIKLTHLECCSVEELKQCLLTQAQNQIKMYQDVIELINNMSLAKIKDFEVKYGMYEELRQDHEIDYHVMISALISELKRRSGTK